MTACMKYLNSGKRHKPKECKACDIEMKMMSTPKVFCKNCIHYSFGIIQSSCHHPKYMKTCSNFFDTHQEFGDASKINKNNNCNLHETAILHISLFDRDIPWYKRWFR